MAPRLIAVSNRIPMGDHPSGGLVVALHDALAGSGGVWIGAHPDAVDQRDAATEGLERIAEEPYRRLAFRLTDEEVAQYYLGYANSVLWPLCHRRVDLVDLQTSFEECYRAVNARVARLVAEVAGPEDLIWIHDYHFFPLACELRKLGLENRIGFFLHIPFPSLGDLSVLSQPQDFADWLSHYNLLGLQTSGDVARCLEMYRADPRAEFMTDGTVKFRDRITTVRSFPIGINVADFQAEAETAEENPFGREAPEAFVIGVDRLDYSKGIPNRFLAFGRYLENRRDGARTCLVQIAPPSRLQVLAYQQITRELEEIAGRVNGTYAEIDWTPIRYIHRSLSRGRLARLFRLARACLVTSFADGMNLVAKEYVAAQDPADPGVLILSRFAGAAEDMTEALLVNPYDIDEMAAAIATALEMPLEERKRRHVACMDVVERTDAAHWTASILRMLIAAPPTLVPPWARGPSEGWRGARSTAGEEPEAAPRRGSGPADAGQADPSVPRADLSRRAPGAAPDTPTAWHQDAVE